jgi:hypothetical protein
MATQEKAGRVLCPHTRLASVAYRPARLRASDRALPTSDRAFRQPAALPPRTAPPYSWHTSQPIECHRSSASERTRLGAVVWRSGSPPEFAPALLVGHNPRSSADEHLRLHVRHVPLRWRVRPNTPHWSASDPKRDALISSAHPSSGPFAQKETSPVSSL